MPRGFDPAPSNPAVPQLVHLHAQLGAKLLANRKERAKLAADMKHVEAVIRLFDPAYDTRRIAVKRRNRPNPLLRKGTAWLNAVGVLRVAEKPLTVREVAERVLTAKGIALGPKAVKDMVNALHASFTNHKGKSIVRVGNDQPARWRLI
ncbi:MAG: hypothetical protein WDO17_13705 [Alphaproteobacteria bacterium]